MGFTGNRKHCKRRKPLKKKSDEDQHIRDCERNRTTEKMKMNSHRKTEIKGTYCQ